MFGRLRRCWRRGREVVTFLRPGQFAQPGEELGRAAAVVLTVTVVLTNLVGVAAVLAVAYLVLPSPTDDPLAKTTNAAMAAAYVLIAIALGHRLARIMLRPVTRWLASEAPSDARVQRRVLKVPLRLFELQFALWLVAAALFGGVNVVFSGALGVMVAVTIAITGLTTSACAYLLAERIMRKPASRALSTSVPDRLVVPGVATRAVLAWAFGSGAPVLGLLALAITALAGGPGDETDLAIAVISFGGLALLVGVLAVTLAARATADPIDTVTGALDSVQRGGIDVRVPVYDGTQIGRLQLGFNRMAEGLAERERIRTALATYVDEDVAERIVQEGASLAAEQVEVTVMFIDIRGFTEIAEHRDPAEVLELVNSLFELVIPVIHRHGGYVDKFIGDGAMAVFGAPRALVAHADAALRAATEIAGLVRRRLPIRIGIGLNSGPVVAGNVGGAGRLEYSVIGDVVNVASRVEVHTRITGDDVLVAQSTRQRLTGADGLVPAGRVELKGKSAPVAVYALRGGS